MYYVYSLIDPRNNKPFYVGKGKKENDRHNDHFAETLENTTNRAKFYKIQYLKKHGYIIPVEIIYDNVIIESEAYDLEEVQIALYGRQGYDKNGILTNICKNNRPPDWTGRKQTADHITNRVASYKQTVIEREPFHHSARTKEKIKRFGPDNGFYNKHHTTEFKKTHSERMKGNRNNSKSYALTDPDDKTYIVTGKLYAFCVEHNLVASTIEKMLYNGIIPKSGKCVGWTIKRQ